jgi:ATP-dependent RNA helicase DHR2
MPEIVHNRLEADGGIVINSRSEVLESTTISPSLPLQGKKRKRKGPTIIEETLQILEKSNFIKPKTVSSVIDIASKSQNPQKSDPPNGRLGDLDRKDQGDTKKALSHGSESRPTENTKSLNEKKKILLKARQQLPIWPHAEKIRKGLHGDKDVMLLVGETGSGKSTQVPQFLMEEPWCQKCIAITQPRRVAAISLARRVADEMGTPLGSSSPASKVGYSVRFDLSVSPSTKIKFLTEGMLLQEMLRDPWLRQYSAVIVDEVHERSVNVDLILGFLRNLVSGDQKGRKGQRMKVVVMSATADVDSLFKFFDSVSMKFFVEPGSSESINDTESEQSWAGIASEDEISTPKFGQKRSVANGNNVNHTVSSSDDKERNMEQLGKASENVTVCYVKGRQYEVKLQYLSQPTLDFQESALKAVFELHMHEPLPGDILVFMTGQDTVEGLERLINEYASTMDPKYPKVCQKIAQSPLVSILTEPRS